MEQTMKALVTGASGFIGSHVTRSLINAGHDVLALAKPDDNLWRLQKVLPHFDVLRGTFQDMPAIKEKLRTWQPNACIHLAWYAEPGQYLNARENLGSLQGSLNLLQILSECGCEHFIGAGTCAEYEMRIEMLTEIDKTKPGTLYAASKLSLQMIGEQLATQVGMQFVWGRIFYLYGAQEDPRRLVPAAILKLSDVANAFLAMMERRVSGIYNICSAEPVTIRELLDTIGSLTGRPELLAYGALPYRDWEPMFICGKNDRLKSTGWLPQVSLQVGLQDTINWWSVRRENNLENNN
jgi:UDP-glucuronate decarboxylase